MIAFWALCAQIKHLVGHNLFIAPRMHVVMVPGLFLHNAQHVLCNTCQALTTAPASEAAPPLLRTLLQLQDGQGPDSMVHLDVEPFTTVAAAPTLAPGLSLPPQVSQGATDDAESTQNPTSSYGGLHEAGHDACNF